MKRLISVILLLALVLSMCACGSDNKSETKGSPSKTEMAEEAIAVVEDCKIEDVTANSFVLHSKIRNISDKDFRNIIVNFQLLDANGDAIGSMSQMEEDVQAGQAVWTGNYTITDVDINEVDAIAYVGCRYQEYGSELTSMNIPLAEKAVFKVADLIGAAPEGAFTLRNDIRFGDSYDAVQSKESIPLTGQKGTDRFFGGLFVWSDTGTIAGFDNSTVCYTFDKEDKLYNMEYKFIETSRADFSESRYETIYDTLVKNTASQSKAVFPKM